jgi:hypothetical protein
MEAVCSSEASVSTNKSTRSYNPEDHHRYLRRRENLKRHALTLHSFLLFKSLIIIKINQIKSVTKMGIIS